MTYRDTLKGLSADAERQAVGIFDRFSSGDLDFDTAVAVLAAVVAKANARAVALADLALAATLMRQLRRPVATIGLLPPAGDAERLHKAATTLLSITDVTPARVARLARVEPLTAASTAYSEAVKKSPHVTGWRRGTHGTKCQLCNWWSRGGQVWSAETPLQTHKGCTCTQIPVN